MIDFMWLEITGKCQLECGHCYASSGPNGTHGTMTSEDWMRVIDQGAALGVSMVQFIGGEPTLHPDLPMLVRHALDAAVEVEIYTNLVHVTPAMWQVFRQPGVRLATSYYSDDASEHQAITRRPTLKVTTKNIARAQEFGIPLRAGVIGVLGGQRSGEGIALLERLGVPDVGYDDLREVGRGVRENGPGVEQLCGQCGDRKIAISPSGEVWPCVFSRWLPVGNVREMSLADIATSETFARVIGDLRGQFTTTMGECAPKTCNPKCSPSCSPSCKPANNCGPSGNCAPKYSCGPCAPKDRVCNPGLNCVPNKCGPDRCKPEK
ncbi:radical SAM protein [Microtetraspora sp. AC03309]|uniref:radical SAM protein n=1 Tax=Microtetraspora sp. AC03309 TaxID=2779376 RepID=UPI001E2E5FE0|nr:radical SAM protein [Microtetraspora sp. AC03309]